MLKGCSPELVDALEVTTNSDGKLSVPVVAAVPPHLLGAGAGLVSDGGSIHIQTADSGAVKEAGLDNLRLGDVVALTDYDSSWNHGYLRECGRHRRGRARRQPARRLWPGAYADHDVGQRRHRAHGHAGREFEGVVAIMPTPPPKPPPHSKHQGERARLTPLSATIDCEGITTIVQHNI